MSTQLLGPVLASVHNFNVRQRVRPCHTMPQSVTISHSIHTQRQKTPMIMLLTSTEVFLICLDSFINARQHLSFPLIQWNCLACEGVYSLVKPTKR
jgi:hypothetical protein